MVLLENDAFLNELTKLFERTRSSGSVSSTMKIVKEGVNKPLPKGTKKPTPTLEEIRAEGSGYGVLVRATDGKRKVSTFVKKDKAAKFSKSYQTILLAYVELGDALKEKKKKKKKAPVKKKATGKPNEAVEKKSEAPSTSGGATASAGSKTKGKTKGKTKK